VDAYGSRRHIEHGEVLAESNNSRVGACNRREHGIDVAFGHVTMPHRRHRWSDHVKHDAGGGWCVPVVDDALGEFDGEAHHLGERLRWKDCLVDQEVASLGNLDKRHRWSRFARGNGALTGEIDAEPDGAVEHMDDRE